MALDGEIDAEFSAKNNLAIALRAGGNEYSEIKETIVPQVVETIADCIVNVIKVNN